MTTEAPKPAETAPGMPNLEQINEESHITDIRQAPQTEPAKNDSTPTTAVVPPTEPAKTEPVPAAVPPAETTPAQTGAPVITPAVAVEAPKEEKPETAPAAPAPAPVASA